MTDRDDDDTQAPSDEGRNTRGAASDTPSPLPPVSSAGGVRTIRHRKGQRTERFRGETVAVELRDARLISAALKDESAAGFGIYVADGTLFRPTQSVAVWRRGQRHRAVVQYVTGAGEVARLGIKLFPA